MTSIYEQLIKLEKLVETQKLLLMSSIETKKEVAKQQILIEFLLKNIKVDESSKLEFDKAMTKIKEIDRVLE